MHRKYKQALVVIGVFFCNRKHFSGWRKSAKDCEQAGAENAKRQKNQGGPVVPNTTRLLGSVLHSLLGS